MFSEVGQRLFEKCLALLEQRLKLKVKNAVLIIDTDYGEISLELNQRKQPENLILVSRYFNEKLVKFVSRSRAGSSIITCGLCLGVGETIEGGSLRTCSKCKGGGEVVQILNREFTGQDDPLKENDNQQIQIH